MFEEKLEELQKGLEILKEYPEILQEKAFNYLFSNNVTSSENLTVTSEKPMVSVSQVDQKNLSNEKYARIFTYDGEKVYLHKKIPGSNNAVKTKNIALIVLYAKGGVPIYGDEIKGLCEKNGCLDKTNFATTFDSDVNNFIKKGKKGSSKWTLELTMDGQEAAERLLEEILSANK